MTNNSKLFNNTFKVLSTMPEIAIKNSKLWKLTNYDFLFGEILIDFKTSNILCPQGYLFEDPNSEILICGTSNSYDLKKKLGLKFHPFDTMQYSTDIFLRRNKSKDNPLEERIIINSKTPLLISKEGESIMGYEKLKVTVDLSPNKIGEIDNLNKSNRLARLFTYLQNDIHNEYFSEFLI